MRKGELDCIHGIGHSVNTHGCDGCCNALVVEAKAQAWEEGALANWDGFTTDKERISANPYRGENK